MKMQQVSMAESKSAPACKPRGAPMLTSQSTHTQQYRPEATGDDLSDGGSTTVPERELARRADRLLAENERWLALNSDKLISSCLKA
jgi:hypothetical protein